MGSTRPQARDRLQEHPFGSIYTNTTAAGKINRHWDTWDSIQDQEYLSKEGVADLLGQLGQFFKVQEDARQPVYRLLRRAAGYEVREYPSMPAVEYRGGNGPREGSRAFGVRDHLRAEPVASRPCGSRRD